jgi:hypothetical protein
VFHREISRARRRGGMVSREWVCAEVKISKAICGLSSCSTMCHQKNGRGSSSPVIIFPPSRTARLHRQWSSAEQEVLNA